MPIFKIESTKLVEIKEKRIELEKTIQKITEDNLKTIFGYDFISSEFALHNSRIDSFAFNSESCSFIIIEYKKDRNFSVIDQGYSYLALMLNNKADFILEYNEKTGKNLKRDDIDWTQSKVMFISPNFTNYQKGAIDFKDLPIELWEVKAYDNDTVLYNELRPSNTSESIKTVSKNPTINEVSQVIKDYSPEDLIKSDWKETKTIFDSLNESLLNLDSRIQQSITKSYIGYKIGFNNVVSVRPLKTKLAIELLRVDKQDLKDPDNRIQTIQWEKYKYGKVCKIEIETADDIEYVLYLARQIIDKFYK